MPSNDTVTLEACATCGQPELVYIPHYPGQIPDEVGSLYVCRQCSDWYRRYGEGLRLMTKGDLREIGNLGALAAVSSHLCLLTETYRQRADDIKHSGSVPGILLAVNKLLGGIQEDRVKGGRG